MRGRTGRRGANSEKVAIDQGWKGIEFIDLSYWYILFTFVIEYSNQNSSFLPWIILYFCVLKSK